MGNLFIIATPIGNLKDITLRAVETLFSLDLLLCEDTRKTKRLLDFYKENLKLLPNNEWLNINFNSLPQLLSFFEENEAYRLPYVLAALSQNQNVGLVSNAGTPGISDPGFSLVSYCIKNNIPVITIPGSSAVISGLSISGFSADKFTFLGFLPKKSGKQVQIWTKLFNSSLDQTIIFYESPFSIKKTLSTLQTVFGDIEVGIARELTKIHENFCLLPISQWLSKLNTPLKGELVVMFRMQKS